MDGITIRVWLQEDQHKENALQLELPDTMSQEEGLASQLWPAALASAMVLRSPEFQEWITGKSLVELGSGRGLAGLVAAAIARSCLLTDNDEEAVELLETATVPANREALTATLSTQQVDWRDDHRGTVAPVDLVLGSDIAYYYHLLRPFMDTSRAFMDVDPHSTQKSSLMVIGQGNRESQWELYKNIRDGCYNQLTDVKEIPWTGKNRMLLYKLQMSEWCSSIEECEKNVNDLLPMSLLLHQDDADDTDLLPFGANAHVATLEDDESIMKSF